MLLINVFTILHFYHYLSILFHLYKKIAVKHYAVLCSQQPHTSHIYHIS